MKKIIILVISTFALSLSAFADGFVCQTLDQDMTIRIYNNVNPEVGTRVGAVMVISDQSVLPGKKTTARFRDTNGQLTNNSSKYTANVDLRYTDVEKGGRNILGTKLDLVDTIDVKIAFSYAYPVADGAKVAGKVVVNKRNGAKKVRYLDCTRYLKNDNG